MISSDAQPGSSSTSLPSLAGQAAACIVDAGVGNLGNLARALRALGSEPTITSDAQEIADARCLVLPGVGAFRPPRERLRGGLEEALRSAVAGGAWLLGICVGFQLLFESSEEFGHTDGLGLLPGTVARLPDTVPLPHIGWNSLEDVADHPLVEGLDGAYVYFVHTYAPEISADILSENDSLVLARCRHGRSFPAIAARGRVMGTQFHPEKSADSGLRLLANFLEMTRGSATGD